MQDILQWIYDTSLSTSIRESEITFPALESVHVLSLTLMVGTIAIVDLRVLGWILRDVPAFEVERRIVPATWIGFVVMAISGLLLFGAEAAKLGHNPAFLIKVALLILAGLNMAAFQLFQRPSLSLANAQISGGARIGAGLSLFLWMSIVAAGRAIAYFH